MKQERIYLRVTTEEKALLLKKAGSQKLSKYLLLSALGSPVKPVEDVEIRIVRESCDICGRNDFRMNRHTKRKECVHCVKLW